jgi:hypothetical protein
MYAQTSEIMGPHFYIFPQTATSVESCNSGGTFYSTCNGNNIMLDVYYSSLTVTGTLAISATNENNVTYTSNTSQASNGTSGTNLNAPLANTFLSLSISLPPGTYTFSVLQNGMVSSAAFNQFILSVINGNNVTATPQVFCSNNICYTLTTAVTGQEGYQGTINFGDGTGNIAWSSISGNSPFCPCMNHVLNYTGPLPHTFNVTGTSTNTCGTASFSSTITLTDNLIQPTLASNLSKCTTGTNTYSVTNPQPGYNYVWSVVGGVITSGQNTPTVSVVWSNTNQPSSISVYAIAVNENSSCPPSPVTTLQLPACCDAASPAPTFYTNVLSSNFSSTLGIAINGSSGLTITNLNFGYNGTWTVDQNTTLNSANIYLGNQTKIVVMPGKSLKIHSSHLEAACNYRWAGIVVLPGGSIEIDNNSIIEDADIAVKLSSSGSSLTTYLFNNVTFNNNYYHLHLSSMPANAANIIRNCNFGTLSSSNALPTTNSDTIFHVNTNPQFNSTYTAIYILNSTVNVGASQEGNVFDRAYRHISINGLSLVNCIDNSFINSLSPYYYYSSSGIVGNSGSNLWGSIGISNITINAQGNNFRNLKYGIISNNISSSYFNYSVNSSNQFSRCIYSIYLIGKHNTTIDQNTFNSPIGVGNKISLSAITILNNKGTYMPNGTLYKPYITITNNHVYDMKRFGINLSMNDNSANTIRYNVISAPNIQYQPYVSTTIVGSTAVSSNIYQTGISCAHQASSSGTSYMIEENTIGSSLPNQTNDLSFGIYCNRAGSKLKILNNHIKLKSLSGSNNVAYNAGIEVNNTDRSIIKSNDIDGFKNENDWDAWKTEGIRLGNCTSPYVYCNFLTRLGDMILFLGPSTGAQIHGNKMFNGYRGIFFGGAYGIGPQGSPGTSTYSPVAQDNEWRFIVNNNKTWVSWFDGSGIRFYVRNPSTDPFYSPFMDLDYYTDCKFSSASYGAQTSVTLLPLSGMEPSCQIPGTLTMSIAEMWQYLLTDEVVAGISDSSTQVAIRYIMKEGLYEKLKSYPDLMNNFVFASFMDSAEAQNVGSLLFADESYTNPTDITIRAEAIQRNSDVVPNSEAEALMKKLNEILLGLERIEYEFIDSTKQQLLYEIASQCPFDKGSAVYRARAVLSLVSDSVGNIQSDCELVENPNNPNSRRAQNQTSVSSKNLQSLQLIPSETGFVFNNEFTNAKLIIFDLLGKKITEFNLEKGLNRIDLEMSAGSIYIGKIYSSGQYVESMKFVK